MSRLMLPPKPNWGHPLNKGLVAWWPMLQQPGGQLVDIVNKSHGTLVGMTDSADWAPCPVGQRYRLSFASTGDYVDCGGSTTGHPLDITGDLTIGLWAKLDNDSRFLLSKGDGTNYQYAFYSNTSSKVTLFYANNQNDSSPNNSIMSGEWAYYAVTMDDSASLIAFYVNGRSVGTAAASASLISRTEPLYIGARKNGGSTDFEYDDQLSDIQLYDRALSASEIKALYQESLQGYPNLLQSQPRIYNIPFEPKKHSTIGGAVRRRRNTAGAVQGVNWGHSLNKGLRQWLPMMKGNTGFVPDIAQGNRGVFTRDGAGNWTDRYHVASYGNDQRLATYHDGTSGDYISCPDKTSYSSISAFCWIRSSDFTQSWKGWLGKVSTKKLQWSTNSTNRTMYLAMDISGWATVINASTTALSDDVWYHVGFTYEDSTDTGTFYVNGKADGTGTRAGTTSIGVENWEWGTTESSNYFNGEISDAKIYSRALSASEVCQLYNESLQGHPNLLRRSSNIIPIKSKPNTSKVGVRRKTTGGTSGNVTGVNWSSPLNKGLVAWFPLFTDELVDVVRGIKLEHGTNDELRPWGETTQEKPSPPNKMSVVTTSAGGTVAADVLPVSELLDDLTVSYWRNVGTQANGGIHLTIEKSNAETEDHNSIIYLNTSSTTGGEDVQYIHEYGAGQNEVWTPTDPNFPVKEWHHITFTKDKSAKALKLYIDGKLWDSTTYTNDLTCTGTTTGIGIGNRTDRSGSANPAVFQDIRIGSKCLTPEEVRVLYEESLQGYPNLLRRSGGPAIPVSRHHSKPVLSSPTEADITDTTVTIGASTTVTD